MRRLALLLAAALLASGCWTREFYLPPSEVPWEERHIARVSVPAFQGPPNAWAAADEARRRVVAALGRGTVQVVDAGLPADAKLEGALTDYVQSENPGGARRVLEGQNQLQADVYVWQVDVMHVVQFGVSLRVTASDGAAVWSRSNTGEAHETSTTNLDWPGDDPVPPPTIQPFPPDPSTYERLRGQALDQALSPLLDALATRYDYRRL